MTALIDAAQVPDHLRDAKGNHLRHDGWTSDRRRDFLAHLADGHTVEDACRLVGKSPSSAYALRRRADGAAFALGWRAATLVARDHLADTMLHRALNGVTDTYTRADGTTVERHRHDNRLGTTLLRRLDNQADAATPGGAAAARLVAGDFDAFLDLVAADAAPARAGLFLAARLEGQGALAPPDALAPLFALARADRFARTRAGTAGQVDTADLDPAARANWTPDQWLRAEAAGLVALAPDPADAPREEPPSPPLPPLEDAPPVWWDEHFDEWRTAFPPPPGFTGHEVGEWDRDDYHRALSAEEADVADAHRRLAQARRREAEVAERDAWFARAADDVATASHPDPAPHTARPTEPQPGAARPPGTGPEPEPTPGTGPIAPAVHPSEGCGPPPATSGSTAASANADAPDPAAPDLAPWLSAAAPAPLAADPGRPAADPSASAAPRFAAAALPRYRPPPRLLCFPSRGTPPPAAR